MATYSQAPSSTLAPAIMASKLKPAFLIGGLLIFAIAGATTYTFWSTSPDAKVATSALDEKEPSGSHRISMSFKQSSKKDEPMDNFQVTSASSIMYAHYLNAKAFVKARWVLVTAIAVLLLAAVVSSIVIGVYVHFQSQEALHQAESAALAKQQEQLELDQELAKGLQNDNTPSSIDDIGKANVTDQLEYTIFLYTGIAVFALNVVASVIAITFHPLFRDFSVGRKVVVTLVMIVFQQGIIGIILHILFGLFILYAMLLQRIAFRPLRFVLGVLGIVPAILSTVICLLLLPTLAIAAALKRNGTTIIKDCANACSKVWKFLLNCATFDDVKEAIQKVNRVVSRQ